ncbi:MAG: hypothetical protein KIT84_40140 [Labilithrix sp.]|nr:hypothetical protein [Labilithrix sp.]MCW5817277.1 hypothetical protein [Labilithrix sp.]
MNQQRSTWGHCAHCKFFASPARAPLDGEEAACGEPTLEKFQLRVVGVGGCNHFTLRPGLTERVEEPRLYV